MAIDKETLFKELALEEIVEIEGKGDVRIRALTRHELHSMNAGGEKTKAVDVEYKTVHYGMVDPALDINEVKEWAKVASVGEFQTVLKAIMTLSGMNADEEEVKAAQAAAYKSIRGRS